MRYNVGDRVRITTDKSKSQNWNDEGKMDKWLGKIMTIRDNSEPEYKMEEDYYDCYFREGGWAWFPEMIEGLADDELIDITNEDFMEVLSL